MLNNGAHAALDRQDPALADHVKALTDGKGADLALDPTGDALFIACPHALAPLGMAVSYNSLGGPPSADVIMQLRTLLGRSLAVRTCSMHSFDAHAPRRRRPMQAGIELTAQGAVQAPPTTALAPAEARGAHELLDAPGFMGKLVLRS